MIGRRRRDARRRGRPRSTGHESTDGSSSTGTSTIRRRPSTTSGTASRRAAPSSTTQLGLATVGRLDDLEHEHAGSIAGHARPGTDRRRRRTRGRVPAARTVSAPGADRPGDSQADPTIDSYLETLDHEDVLVRRGRRSGLYTFVAVHSTVRGPSLGGCRMWGYADARQALRDALRLSRAMTYKSAVADLPLGGGKGVIMTPPGDRPLLRAPDRGAARLRRHGRVARRPLHHRRGRRHLQPRHEGDRAAHRARRRASARAGRVGRPEPVHGAGRRGRDPRLLRAGVLVELAASSGRSPWSGSATSARGSPSAAPRPAPGWW